jgi:hypothetical protein
MTGVTASGGILDAAAALGVPPPVPPPAAPATAGAVSLGGGSARVTWLDSSSNETGFEVQREARAGNLWTGTSIVGTVGANGTSFVDACGRGRFRYRVRAVNGAGASAWTGWAEVNVR